MTELITIGALARTCGLTTSALRFYDDSGLLVPTEVDAVTGYRYYSLAQCDRAIMIRRLREIGVPLTTVSAVLAGNAETAALLLDTHVEKLRTRADDASKVVEAWKKEANFSVAVPGIALAHAVEQVFAAVARSGEFRVLNGIYVEVEASSITLTATDRYRLTTRSLVAESGASWSCVVDAESLRAAVTGLHGIARIQFDDRFFVDHTRCTIIDEPFPDYRVVLRGLGTVTKRVVVDRGSLAADVESSEHYSAAALGADMVFDSANLLPPLRSAIGPEVMLDFFGPQMPVLIRSADDGDLTSLVMPIEGEPS